MELAVLVPVNARDPSSFLQSWCNGLCSGICLEYTQLLLLKGTKRETAWTRIKCPFLCWILKKGCVAHLEIISSCWWMKCVVVAQEKKIYLSFWRQCRVLFLIQEEIMEEDLLEFLQNITLHCWTATTAGVCLDTAVFVTKNFSLNWKVLFKPMMCWLIAIIVHDWGQWGDPWRKRWVLGKGDLADFP